MGKKLFFLVNVLKLHSYISFSHSEEDIVQEQQRAENKLCTLNKPLLNVKTFANYVSIIFKTQKDSLLQYL